MELGLSDFRLFASHGSLSRNRVSSWTDTTGHVAWSDGHIFPKGQRYERLKDAFGEKAKYLNTKLEIVAFMVKKKNQV